VVEQHRHGRVTEVERRLRLLVDLAIVIAVVILIWIADLVLSRIAGVMTDILVAVLVAYLIFPLVRPLAQRMPRAVAILLVYVVLLGILGAGIATTSPILAAQAHQLTVDFPRTLAHARSAVENAPAPLPILAPLEPTLRNIVANYAFRADRLTGTAAAFVGAHAVGIVRGSVRVAVNFAIVLLLAFFFITDVERIRGFVLRLLPAPRRDAALAFITDCDAVIGAFVRGQVVLALAVGIVATLILLIAGVRYAALLGFIVGTFSIVPLVGPIVGAFPALAVALLTTGPVKAAIVLVLFVVVFEVQSHVLTPVVIGKALGVTPLVIVLAILVGAETHGVVGMLLAVPLAGIARVVLDRVAATR
jgi:predicted PurR-regulated permease PerM